MSMKKIDLITQKTVTIYLSKRTLLAFEKLKFNQLLWIAAEKESKSPQRSIVREIIVKRKAKVDLTKRMQQISAQK